MTEQKRALILGISGQDGSYLSRFLLEKGYKVFGTVRRHSLAEGQDYRISKIPGIETFYSDLTDKSSLDDVLNETKPDEIYNLAAQSLVSASFKIPYYTCETNALGVLNLLESFRNLCPKSRLYQASSSEMFGNNKDLDGYNRETTPLEAVSPYGAAKIFAHNLCKIYRDSYNLFISTGILHNHESPMRGSSFVTAKIVKGACEIKHGNRKTLELGNLQASRDWTHSKDMVRGMWMILNHHKPETFLLSSQETHTVEEFCQRVFEKLDMNYKDYVVSNPKYFRPNELHILKGDSIKARSVLGWSPEISFDELIDEMIEYWTNQVKAGCLI